MTSLLPIEGNYTINNKEYTVSISLSKKSEKSPTELFNVYCEDKLIATDVTDEEVRKIA